MKKWLLVGTALAISLVIILNTAFTSSRAYAPATINATVDVSPAKLKLGAPLAWQNIGKWFTCYIELPAGYNPSDIDISSIVLNGALGVDPGAPTSIGDHDGDGIPDLMIKFKRGETHAVSDFGGHAFFTRRHNYRYCYPATLAITGELFDSTIFSGEGTLWVLWPNHVMPK